MNTRYKKASLLSAVVLGSLCVVSSSTNAEMSNYALAGLLAATAGLEVVHRLCVESIAKGIAKRRSLPEEMDDGINVEHVRKIFKQNITKKFSLYTGLKVAGITLLSFTAGSFLGKGIRTGNVAFIRSGTVGLACIGGYNTYTIAEAPSRADYDRVGLGIYAPEESRLNPFTSSDDEPCRAAFMREIRNMVCWNKVNAVCNALGAFAGIVVGYRS